MANIILTHFIYGCLTKVKLECPPSQVQKYRNFFDVVQL